MYKTPPLTKQDLRDAAIIQRKQRIESDRKSRIFDARNRVIGVDRDGLQQQLAEKKARQEHDNELHRKYMAEEQRRIVVLNAKANELAKERQQIEREMNEFRLRNQRKEFSSVFDVTDPKYKQKSLPARVGDDDPRLSVSGAQKFLGEDLQYAERQRLQRAQQKAWLQQQMHERSQAKAAQDEARRMMEKALDTRNRRVHGIEAAERDIRKQIHTATAEFNRSLAEDQRGQRERMRREEWEDNQAEIYNNLTSDMLLETKDCASSNLGIGRKVVTMFRGMTDEEVATIQKEQHAQVCEQKQRRNEKQHMDECFEEISLGLDRMGLARKQEVEKERQKQAILDQDENSELAQMQKTTKEHLDRVVYTNPPTMEYFSQFNTTSR